MKRSSVFMMTIGVIFLSVIILAVSFAPVLTNYDPADVDAEHRFLSPSQDHIMGTDHFGRDIFSRLLYGGRISLPVTFVTLFLTALIGTTLGIATALYYNRLFDIVIMRLVDAILAIPFIVLAMSVSAIFGRGLDKILMVVVVIWWAPFTRYTRSLVLGLKNQEAIQAAKILGASPITIVWREIIPNIAASIFIYLTFEFSSLILILATLSFFGLGSQPPTPEWGNMLSDGRTYINQSYHMLLWPIVAIIATVLGLNLLGEGLRDYLYPHDMIVLRRENKDG